jgi:PAS domain S-box-containing protein
MNARPTSFSDARQNPRKSKNLEALRESEEQYRTIVNNLPQLAWMADVQGTTFWYNQRWFEYTGTTLEEMAADGWEKALPPEQSLRVHNKFKRCLRSGKVWEDTFPLRDGNGNYRWFLSQATPVRDAEGKLAHWLGTHTDISEIRKMEEQLLAEKDHALVAWEEKIRLQANLLEQAREAKARLQENFLSRVSHELRTPLTAIYFFTTNLLDGILGDLTGPQHEQLELALTNVCQLRDMVSDLIDISRIDTHKVALELQYTTPKKLINEVLATCRTNAASKRINLRSDLPENLPALWADVSRVRQILTNLIDNGIKFTPKGGTVTVGQRAVPGEDAFLCLTVADTGCGIPPEKLEFVFDRLAQLENGSGANRSGLGLGLYITRELVTLQGGRIWVESAVGRGSTFYVSLPLFSMDKQLAHIFTAENLSDGRVTLITVDVSTIEGGAQGDIDFEIRRVLSLCIHPGQDLLLPAIGEAEPVASYFIVACTGAQGADIITHRISRDLKKFDSASKLKPVISSTTLLLAAGTPPVDQTREIARQIERLIQTRLTNGSSASHFSKPVSLGESPAWRAAMKSTNLTETSADPATRQRTRVH